MKTSPDANTISRRAFTRLFAAGSCATVVARGGWGQAQTPQQTPPLSGDPASGEKFWESVRAQFVMAPGLSVMNAANLCPAPAPVIATLERETSHVDRDPSPQNRARLSQAREATRRALANFLRVTPEEIVITRNTSESNNLVSNGLTFKAGDEVVVFSDNHPSNNQAWVEKGKRFGFAVRVVEQKTPHPGADYYIDAFTRAMTPAVKLLAFTHLTNTVGDLFPAKEICAIARARGVLTLLDGAQTFGWMDVNLRDIDPDFYSGSAHKWPCGARECGVLFVHARVHDRLSPASYSAYPGAVGISRRLEAFGQRDEATMIAFAEALAFQERIGRRAIQQRSADLANQFVEGALKLADFRLFTSTDATRRGPVVTFVPGALDRAKLVALLYERDRIGLATGGGAGRSGVRVSPHVYNTAAEVDRLLAALARYARSGLA